MSYAARENAERFEFLRFLKVFFHSLALGDVAYHGKIIQQRAFFVADA